MIAAIIPARGGSVRIPRKNIKPFWGKPMLWRAIDTARESGLFGMVIVSTDDNEIEDVAGKAGALVVRREPDDGAKGTQEVARDVLLLFESIQTACVIYPCVPLLDVDSLRAGLKRLDHWLAFTMSVDEHWQDAGCYYWGHRASFINRVPIHGPSTARVPLPPGRACDINTTADWARAEAMYDVLSWARTIRLCEEMQRTNDAN